MGWTAFTARRTAVQAMSPGQYAPVITGLDLKTARPALAKGESQK